jgi:hypothetical protein
MESEGPLPYSPVNTIQSHMNPVYILILYLFNAHFKNILHVALYVASDAFPLPTKMFYAYLAY